MNLLRLEAIQSFEERKARARRLGEEAGTKAVTSDVSDAGRGACDCCSPGIFYRTNVGIVKI